METFGPLAWIFGTVLTICGTIIFSIIRYTSHEKGNPNNVYVRTTLCNDRYERLQSDIIELKGDVKMIMKHFKIIE